MNMDAFRPDTGTEKIRIAVSEKLSPKKYEHSLKVAQYCWQIAAKTSIDPRKMYIAGLLHDIASEMGSEDILRLCERTDRYIPSNEIRRARSLHGIAGACIAYEEFDIRDSEILMAIAFHSGRVGMQQEEKILFLADMIDHSCQNGYDPARIWRQTDLDSAILAAGADMIDFCIQNDLPMGKRTQDSFDYIIENLQLKTAFDDSAYKSLRINMDEIVDNAIDTFLSHRLKIDSVKNIRDAGNYLTSSGKMIRKHEIIRSGDLSKMTSVDADQLKRLGINTIIDLRTKDEINDAKNRNVEDFRCFNFPLPKLETGDSAKRMLEYIKSSISDEEKVWYAAEFMRHVSMKQLYRDVIISDESIEQISKVFEVLLDSDTRGALIHCSDGKDRTGIVIMLVQYALGMSGEKILNDYYASALPYYMVTESTVLMLEQKGYSGDFSEKARELLGINSNMIKDLYSWWQENKFGSLDDYLSDKIHINEEQIELLRRKYLE